MGCGGSEIGDSAVSYESWVVNSSDVVIHDGY